MLKQAYDTAHKTSGPWLLRRFLKELDIFYLSLIILKASRKHPHLADVENEFEGLISERSAGRDPRTYVHSPGPVALRTAYINDNSKFISEGIPVL